MEGTAVCHTCLKMTRYENSRKRQFKWKISTFSSKTWFCDTTFRVLVLLLVLQAQIFDVLGVEWDTEPQDSMVRENDDLTLRCRVRNPPEAPYFIWTYTPGPGEKSQKYFVNEVRWDGVPDHFNIHLFEEGNVIGYDMTMRNTNRSDDGLYNCDINTGLDKDVAVTVLVNPSQPWISLNNSSPKEGDTVALTCTSKHGNPPPSIRWYRNDVPLDDGETTPPGERFGNTTSILIRHLTRDDHGATYRCAVENDGNLGRPLNEEKTLDVRYAPVIDFNPYNPLVVVERNETVLRCNIQANPAPPDNNVTWEKLGTYLGSGRIHRIPQVLSSDSGEYICRVYHEIETREGSLHLDVQYAPIVKIHALGLPTGSDVLRVNEKAKVNLTCSVKANPWISGAIQWLNEDGIYINDGPNLVLDPVDRKDSGLYKCHAQNRLLPSGGVPQVQLGEAEVHLIVQYEPGQARISEEPEYAIKGQPAFLICDMDDKGEPPAQLEWTRPASIDVIHRGPELMFQPAHLDNNTNYVCKPTNVVGDGVPDTRTFIVNEIPEWLSKLPPEMTKNEGDEGFQITCNVRGRPLPNVRWFKNNSPIDEADGLYRIINNFSPIDKHSFNVTSSLNFKGYRRYPTQNSLLIEDAGNYSCRADNDIISDPLMDYMKLIIKYKPVMNASADKIAIDINQSAIMMCHAHSLPGPWFKWFHGTTELQTGGRISIITEMVRSVFSYRSLLEIRDVTENDLGEYTCRGINDIGSTDINIHLTVKTTPDPPRDLEVISDTWESVELSWKPGFNGGYPQSFIVAYRSTNGDPHRVAVQPPHASRFNVTNLFPDTNYTFKLFGENFLGGGEYSQGVTRHTGDFVINAPTNVKYIVETRILKFQSPSTNYCARVETFIRLNWRIYEKCAPVAGGSMKLNTNGSIIDDVRVAFCLIRRPDVCSRTTSALMIQPEPNDVPLVTIIIVACVCGTVVVILSIILIVLCIRRHQQQKKDEAEANRRAPMVNVNGTAMKNTNLHGIDNPGMATTRVDSIDLDDPTNGGVFATDISQLTPTGITNSGYPNYVMFDRKQNGHMPNGYGPGNMDNNATQPWNQHSNVPSEPPPRYSSVSESDQNFSNKHRENNSSPDSEYVAMHKGKRKDHLDGDRTHLDPNHGSDSGVSTPDPVKPKKVIYEVIV